MLRKTFGKRAAGPASLTASPVHAKAGPERNTITQADWHGPQGETLRRLGFFPDDPMSLTYTPQRMRALEQAAIDHLDALVAKVNAHIPHVAVLPWAIIPWAVWQDANAEFLMKADFLPASPWNNLLLAADENSSAFLGLPQHPRAGSPILDAQLTKLVDELRQETRNEMDRLLAAIMSGDFSVLDRYEQLKTEIFQKLFALARYVAETSFGPEVCAKHDGLFGIGLSGVPA